jgi:hypothetical protein
METITFSKPYMYDGKEYTELQLDFSTLTGNDMIKAEAEARVLGGPMPVPELSKQYQAVVAAKAANVHVDMIMGLPAKDFTKVTMAVQNFLLE